VGLVAQWERQNHPAPHLAGKEDADAAAINSSAGMSLSRAAARIRAGGRCTTKPQCLRLALVAAGMVEGGRGIATATERTSRSGWRRFDYLQHELHRQDAYNIDHASSACWMAWVPSGAFDQPVASLSGGEQNRLMLANCCCRANVMILDERATTSTSRHEWLRIFCWKARGMMS